MIRSTFARYASLLSLTSCLLMACAPEADVEDSTSSSEAALTETERQKKLKELADKLRKAVDDGKGQSIGGVAVNGKGSAKGGVTVSDTPVNGIVVTGEGSADVEFIIDENGDLWIITGANVTGSLDIAIGGITLVRVNGEVGAIAVVNISKLKEAIDVVKQVKEIAKKKATPAPAAPATPAAPEAPATPATPPAAPGSK